MKERKHNFVDKHPVAGSIVMGFVLLGLSQMFGEIGGVIGTLIGFKYPDLLEIIFIIIGAGLLFAWYKHHFSPEFKGVLTGGNFKEGMLMCLPIIPYWIVTAIAMMIDHTFGLKAVTLTVIRTSIMAGVTEELGFRHGVISTLMRNRNTREQIRKNCLISGIAFGLIHLLNVFAGADVIHTVSQVFTAGGHGVFFAAIFASCGNIWPLMILHAVHDVYAISTTIGVTEGGIISSGISFSDIIDLIACVGMGIYALKFYLKDEKLDEIVALWNDKWSKDQFAKPEETRAEEV